MGACQMVTREAFDTVGGFDESYLIAMSDVALCLQFGGPVTAPLMLQQPASSIMKA